MNIETGEEELPFASDICLTDALFTYYAGRLLFFCKDCCSYCYDLHNYDRIKMFQ